MLPRRQFLPIYEPWIGKEEFVGVQNCVRSGWISSLGPSVSKFEKSFAQFCSVKEAVAVCNGTSALHLALVALGIKAGDEVIVPDLTFVATANAAAYTGARVVTADVDPDTWMITPESVARVLTKKTRAVVPVHLYGFAAPVNAIRRSIPKGVAILEDAAEAHGASLRKRPVGGLGDMGAFSFYANKIVTTGEGGMITLNSRKQANRLRHLREHAMSRAVRYRHDEIGFNYAMTSMQAEIGLGQMSRVDKIIAAKRQVAEFYEKHLCSTVVLQKPEPGSRNVYWMNTCLLPSASVLKKTIRNLQGGGVDWRPFFQPISTLIPYRTKKVLPVSRELYSRGIVLPSGPRLTEHDVMRVARIVNSAVEGDG